MKILIADDEDIVRTSLEGILTKGGGFETDFAFDGREAIEKVKNNAYDALLLDLQMPKIDGYEVLRQVRELYAGMPVVFISGKGETGKIKESIAHHKLNAFIEKPFTPDEVLNVLGKVIKVRKAEI